MEDKLFYIILIVDDDNNYYHFEKIFETEYVEISLNQDAKYYSDSIDYYLITNDKFYLNKYKAAFSEDQFLRKFYNGEYNKFYKKIRYEGTISASYIVERGTWQDEIGSMGFGSFPYTSVLGWFENVNFLYYKCPKRYSSIYKNNDGIFSIPFLGNCKIYEINRVIDANILRIGEKGTNQSWIEKNNYLIYFNTEKQIRFYINPQKLQEIKDNLNKNIFSFRIKVNIDVDEYLEFFVENIYMVSLEEE